MIFRDRPKGTAKHSPANDGFVAISKPQRDAAVATMRSFRRVAKRRHATAMPGLVRPRGMRFRVRSATRAHAGHTDACVDP